MLMQTEGSKILLLPACATAQTPQPPPNNSPIQMNRDAAATRGPVRNLVAQPGEEITTIRYWKIKKGAFPQFLDDANTVRVRKNTQEYSQFLCDQNSVRHGSSPCVIGFKSLNVAADGAVAKSSGLEFIGSASAPQLESAVGSGGLDFS